MRRATWVLILAVVALNVASQAYSLPMTDYIRHRSTSVSSDTALRFAYFALMLITAFVEALLFDELRYRGAWRQHFFGGLTGAGGPKSSHAGIDPNNIEYSVDGASTDGRVDDGDDLTDEELDALKGGGGGGRLRHLIAENSMPFFLALFCFLAGNYFLFNWLNGGFDSYYSKTGHLITQLRSKDAELRCKAILGLSFQRGAKLERLIVDRLEKGSDNEKVWAAWAVGYRRKLKLPNKPAAQLDRAEALLITMAGRGTHKQQRMAVLALARFAERRGLAAGAPVLPTITETLARHVAAGKATVEVVRAVGVVRDKSAIKSLSGLLDSGPESRAMMAAWSLGRMQHSRAIAPLLAALPKAAPQVRCIIVKALGALGHASRVGKLLMDQFNHKDSGFGCDSRVVVFRPDGRSGRIHDKRRISSPTQRYRRRLLLVMWRLGFLNDMRAWLRRMSEKPDFEKSVRSFARARAAQLDRERTRE